jgi:predicted enzyme related to lactoylglutathione lyase
MSHPFSYCELHTRDTGKAKDFYRRLFDWKMSDSPTPAGTYTEIHTGEGLGGGLMAGRPPGGPSHWLVYVRVSDLAASTAKARELGGAVLIDGQAVPDVGSFSIITDPTGAQLGLWEPLKK